MPRDSTSTPADEDAPGPPISVPDSGDMGEGGKLKMIVQLLKKCLGVKDIAAIINDSTDPFDRMLAVLRFAFTKDIKFVHGKVCKPYNSVLGEHFRAHWDIVPITYSGEPSQAPTPLIYTIPAGSEPTTVTSETASVKSTKSSKSTRSGISSFLSKPGKSPSTAATSPHQPADDAVNAAMSSLNLAGDPSRLRVVYVTEQVSHHPPVSAYFATCPARHIELSGIDQISAKVSGTTLRVLPGEYNQGLFVNITGGPGQGERYRITHPTASVNGILRGSFYITVGDSTIITCEGGKPGQKFRAIIEYKEESWLGKAHFLLEGVIHTVHEGDTDHEAWTKVKHVPQSCIAAVFDGSWRGHIRWRRVGLASYPPNRSSAVSSPVPSHETLPRSSISSAAASKAELVAHDEEYTTLLDLSTLKVVPKNVRPLEKQLPHESRKLWVNVTDNLLKKEFSEATKEKVAIEQRQRDEAAERKKKGVEFIPRYFEKGLDKGFAALTAEGRAAVEEELKEESAFCIEGSEGSS
ncbi:hypothetical protein DXG03_005921 [Asterophora parasitica]|uniref:Oxysterol-binding protein n=1 Tax=Asterophora parasitica TaxID=117018 RepID=A0A9P7KF38_9AGAR|nr:hypothetical protein DXG03_005921 [Asterophora parasitica]